MTHESEPPAHGSASEPDELRDKVERTRAELGETVEALAAKADVKARAKDRAAHVKEQASEAADTARTKVSDVAHQAQDKLSGPAGSEAARSARDPRAIALLAASAGALVLWLARRRRRK
ncbi:MULTISPECIES: DUF3618 domain-containing protein [unclassified Streptomyces]|uniref:DUF3618 domain-containing protein n=1 Tax=unclassified Streptomyces TaxID=2593676 RepID=UPI000DB949A8|nr:MULTISPECIES: DUF3618 domain-containing protein [unclassified Streptomyces]MYT74868.1 DUF3618 domain-containing protein [Streptomyces sp. SID8367]RAJ91855.1 uncharacterized protein DUF3618 [Streptomyces sp. PsTaAH-137]